MSKTKVDMSVSIGGIKVILTKNAVWKIAVSTIVAVSRLVTLIFSS